MSKSIDKIIDEVKSLSVLELSELVKSLEEEFGVSAAAPVAVAAPAAVAGSEVSEAEEKTEFDVVLKSIPEKKALAIKTVREITGVGMMDAKALVESAPVTIKEAVSKEDAESIKAKLVALGADVEVK
ncbi:MAG: 50S ribosomal protein L7/L12 [Oscillospiraceae bacterium]|jgi:large subunit ribosomal protein L7/L12|nr:50S ribosomal protein L7/L12 [Oscillospiraceae bacterium]